MLHDTPTSIVRVLRLTIKGQKMMIAQFLKIPPFTKIVGIILLVYEITKPIKTNHPHTPQPLNL